MITSFQGDYTTEIIKSQGNNHHDKTRIHR